MTSVKNAADCGFLANDNMSHILAGADIVRTKIREDKIKDYLLQHIKSGYFPKIALCKNMKIKFQIFCH